jgi:hypothetical protein
MMPSGHKAFLVQNPKDVELLLMHNRTFAAEYVPPPLGAILIVLWICDFPLLTSLQDRPRRFLPQACRDYREGQGSRC